MTVTTNWPAAAPSTDSISDQLERGRIVRFQRCPIPLPSFDDLEFLRRELPALLTRESVGYHPETGILRGMKAAPAVLARAQRVLKDHSLRVERYLLENMPLLTRDWRVAACSFRPRQDRGRNRAYGATHGDRVLRFFVNLHPHESHIWITNGTFPQLLRKYGEQAGLTPERLGRDLSEGPLRRAFSAALRVLGELGLPLDRVFDSSPYDRAMRRFHDFMEDGPVFRADGQGIERVEFPPLSAWLVFGDMVSYARLFSRHGLASTFIIPRHNCRFQSLVPYNILEETLRR